MVEFGCLLPQESADYSEVKKIAQDCEKLGFDSVWLYEHVFPFWRKPDEPILECWTTLSALASDTKTLKLGTIVLSNTFRHPPILAKMAATLDVISNGRLEFGIGAGVSESEHYAYGIPFEKPSIRIERLREAVHIIETMWAHGRCSYKGKYYTVEDAFLNPRPIQKPYPRVWIGGLGKKVLRVVAELGGGSNFWGLDPATFVRVSSLLDDHCKSVGRSPGKITRSWGGEIVICSRNDEVEKRVKNDKPRGVTIDQYVNSSIVGTPERCVERISHYLEAGCEYFMLYFPDAIEVKSLRLFAEQVIPKFSRHHA